LNRLKLSRDFIYKKRQSILTQLRKYGISTLMSLTSRMLQEISISTWSGKLRSARLI